MVTLTVTAANPGGAAVAGLRLSSPLPAGLVYVSQSAVGFDYSPSQKVLTWDAGVLAAGSAITGSFRARAQGLALGEAVTSTVMLTSADLARPLTDLAVIDIVPPAADQVEGTPAQGAILRSSDGRVLLKIPPGAVRNRTRFSYRADPATRPLPWPMAVVFALEAATADGQVVRQFAAPLSLSFRPAADQAARLDQLALSYLDETVWTWRAAPTQAEHGRRVLVAAVDHFTTFGAGENIAPELPPGIVGVKPSLFTGVPNVSYPLELPPGPGGLAPGLALSYGGRERGSQTRQPGGRLGLGARWRQLHPEDRR